MHGLNDIRQDEIETAELLVPKPCVFEVEMATEKLKDTKIRLMIKFQKKLLKQEIGQFVLKSITIARKVGLLYLKLFLLNKCVEKG